MCLTNDLIICSLLIPQKKSPKVLTPSTSDNKGKVKTPKLSLSAEKSGLNVSGSEKSGSRSNKSGQGSIKGTEQEKRSQRHTRVNIVTTMSINILSNNTVYCHPSIRRKIMEEIF